MRIFWLISWLILISININAQSALPPVYEITTDTVYTQMVDSTYWQKLEDKVGNWSFEEVSKEPLAGKFHIKGTKAAGIDTIDIGTYWHRYRFKNAMLQDARISLTSPADFFDVYIIKEDSSVSHYRSGVLRNWDEKDGMKIADRGGAIPLVLKPGEIITVYDRRNKKYDKNFRTSVRFLSTDQIEKKYIKIVDSRNAIYSKLHLQEAFMLGMLLLSTIFSAFLFRVTKEKVYLYFTLFAFFVAINRLWNIANIYTNWFVPEWNQYVEYLGFAWIFIPFFLLLFIRIFFDCKAKYPKWNKILIGLGWLQLSIGLIDLITKIFEINFTSIVFSINGLIVFFVVPLIILITVLLYLRSKNQSHRIVAFGSLPYMLWFITAALVGPEAILWNNASLPISKWLGNNFRLIEMITLGWLIICFTWVLFLRFSKLRKENAQQALDKERLAREKEVERNELIEKQKVQLEIEVEERTLALKQSLEDLKATQSQLIQSEKMASLGELTAGIAHEIQNPLNFVNNFSEVSNELLDEMMEAISKENYAEVKNLMEDVKQNLEKINYHGKRADGIVKGMLQHSRSSNGVKEPTNINALADEYLRLAYHGLRAKDKSFNATMKTDFDESIGNINIIPQDAGRVLLNLFTNAFYAVTDKKKLGIEGYKPTVTVSSKKFDNRVEITVKDNGNGIPQKIADKIFQPFFTTKPTGQGTGLGLSMSYDIITKGHGGTIKLHSQDGEFAEFTIIFPI